MISFLRKIRLKLIVDKKPNRYLIYSIGEVLLIVVGILIALQVNDWNEIQKQLRLEKEILGEIKIGLESDYIKINKAIENHLRYINSGDIIVDWIDRKYPYHDSLSPHFKYTYWTSLFFPNDAQFESLKQFGIRNISNKELGDRISHLYDYVYEDILYWQNEYKSISLDFRSTYDELGFEFVRDSSVLLLDVQPINPESLQSNKAYLFNLNMTSGTLKIFTRGKLINARGDIKKTIEMLENELSPG